MRNLLHKFLTGAMALPAVLAFGALLTTSQNANAQVGGCTLASLNGSYASHLFGEVIGNSAGYTPGPFATSGRWTFDGAGNITVNDTVNYNGSVSNRTLTGNYTVDSSTCRAVVTFTTGAPGNQATLYPSPSGNFATVVVTNPAFVVVNGQLYK